jgi:hypothetical protein
MAGKKKNNKVKETSVENAKNAEFEVMVINRDYSIKGGHRGDTITVYKDIFEPVQEISNAAAYGLMRTTMYKAYTIEGLWEGRDNWEHIESELNIDFPEIDRKVILEANIRGVAVEVITFNTDRLHHIDKALQLYSKVTNLPVDARAKVEKIIDKHQK